MIDFRKEEIIQVTHETRSQAYFESMIVSYLYKVESRTVDRIENRHRYAYIPTTIDKPKSMRPLHGENGEQPNPQ